MREPDDFDILLEEQLKNPKFKAEYDALEPEFAPIHARIAAQKKAAMALLEPEKKIS